MKPSWQQQDIKAVAVYLSEKCLTFDVFSKNICLRAIDFIFRVDSSKPMQKPQDPGGYHIGAKKSFRTSVFLMLLSYFHCTLTTPANAL